MIPAEFKAEIITNGIHFMRAITEAYGTEEGMRLWDTIASTLDPDVKGEIFFAMISGHYNNRIRVSGMRDGANRVAVIKAIRSVDTRRLGLKEAKDMSDHISIGNNVVLEIDPARYSASSKELTNAGLLVF